MQIDTHTHARALISCCVVVVVSHTEPETTAEIHRHV